MSEQPPKEKYVAPEKKENQKYATLQETTEQEKRIMEKIDNSIDKHNLFLLYLLPY